MASFVYKALNGDGGAVTGEISAAGRSEAIARLTAQSIYVTEIEAGEPEAEGESAATAGAPGSIWRLPRSFRLPRRRVSPRVRAAMLRQLATAIQAGLPLLQALRVVQQQAESDALRALTGDLAERVQSGRSLSQALAAHPREFSRMEVSMVRVGETAGVLDEVMRYLTDFAERDLEIREKIRSAATYPLFVMSLAALSVVIIVTVILPKVVHTVSDSVGSVSLPTPTRILLAFSNVLTSYGWVLAIAAVLGAWAFRAWLARPAGRLAFDRFKLRVPVLGTALRRVAVARFARTLGTLSASGIQILEALQVLRDTLGNEALAQQIDRVAADITQGQSIAEPLQQTGQFPPLLIQVIAMGESTGRLDELLLQTAEAYEKETAAAIQRVMTILPAVLIVLLALVVALILAAVLLPIIDMETAIPGM